MDSENSFNNLRLVEAVARHEQWSRRERDRFDDLWTSIKRRAHIDDAFLIPDTDEDVGTLVSGAHAVTPWPNWRTEPIEGGPTPILDAFARIVAGLSIAA